MKILIFSDIHGDLTALRRVLDVEADYYFAAGDLATFGRGLDAVGNTLSRYGQRVFVLPGNHEDHRMIAAMCEQYGLRTFHGKSMELDGYHVAGFGYSNLTPFNTPGEYTEPEIRRGLAPFAALKPLILVCHCPPHGTELDRMAGDQHPGSVAVREFIDQHQPEAFFCGHIHEAHGVAQTLGRTRAWNTGKQGFLLDFDKLKT